MEIRSAPANIAEAGVFTADIDGGIVEGEETTASNGGIEVEAVVDSLGLYSADKGHFGYCERDWRT